MKRFEYFLNYITSHSTKKGVVEHVFDTIYLRIHTIMVHVGLHKIPKIALSPKCVETMNKIENIMVYPHKYKCAYKKFYKNPSQKNCFNNFGQTKILHIIIRLKFKLEFWGITYMFLGYTQNYMGNTLIWFNVTYKPLVVRLMYLIMYWLHTTVIRRDRSREKMIPKVIFTLL